MNQEHNIIKRVLIAQHNIDEADNLIRDYFPFIKSETAKAIGRIPVEGRDDELSVALMGFNEAIESFDQEKGAFLNFASIIIKRRIIDFIRKENQQKNNVSWEETLKDERENPEQASDPVDVVDKESFRNDIAGLVCELGRWGITLTDVANTCPRHDKSITYCRQVIDYLISHPELMEKLSETGKLPVKQIVRETSVNRKLIDKYRKYLLALAIIYYRKYDCIIEHMTEVFKTKKGGK